MKFMGISLVVLKHLEALGNWYSRSIGVFPSDQILFCFSNMTNVKNCCC